MEIQFIIPVDNAIKRFDSHLRTHERTILSAGFGEGKTYFIQKCIENLRDTQFIVLHPVNYQILDNHDVYEVMKRDILFQLIVNNILEFDSISDSVAVSFFVLNNITSISKWVVSTALDICAPNTTAGTLTKRIIPFIDKIKGKYESFCKSHNIGDKNIEDFWDSTESVAYYQPDSITSLISEGIHEWKEDHQGKRIVLLIEDMDRIDPAHLFRILNVLSAQIDLCLYSSQNEDIHEVNNKFGFDNIICVLDLDNLYSLYHHFYGDSYSAEGYISKFCNKGHFEYSLNAEKTTHVYNWLKSISGLSDVIIKRLLPPDIISTKSMRAIAGAIDNIESQINYPEPIKLGTSIRKIKPILLRFCVLLRRFGFSDEKITSSLKLEFGKGEVIHDLLIPFAFLNNEIKDIPDVYFGEKSGQYWPHYNFTQQKEDDENIYFSVMNYGSHSSSQKTHCTVDGMIRRLLLCITE